MLHVDLDNILTHDELASRVDAVLKEADEENAIFVITRNGRPAVAILKLEELEQLSGRSVSPNMPSSALPGMEHNTPAAAGPMNASPVVDAAPAVQPTPAPEPLSQQNQTAPEPVAEQPRMEQQPPMSDAPSHADGTQQSSEENLPDMPDEDFR
jgi:hypothetical protein